MFVLAGCGYVIVRGQTLYGGMIYRPLYKVCPPNSADLVVRYYWVDSRTDLVKGVNYRPLFQVCPLIILKRMVTRLAKCHNCLFQYSIVLDMPNPI